MSHVFLWIALELYLGLIMIVFITISSKIGSNRLELKDKSIKLKIGLHIVLLWNEKKKRIYYDESQDRVNEYMVIT